jgi:hypothetical protein
LKHHKLEEHIKQAKELGKIIQSQKNVINKLVSENKKDLDANFPGLFEELNNHIKNNDLKSIQERLNTIMSNKDSNNAGISNNNR